MPVYEYICKSCEKSFEELVLPGEREPEECPECGNKNLKRLWRGSPGLVFKGSGFYITDYARKSKKEDKKENNNSGCCSPGSSCSCKS